MDLTNNSTKSLKILSWDVGIYNLSYCILEKTDNGVKIIDWDIVNLVDNDEMKKNRSLIFENIPRKLHEKPQLLNVDIVVIENQPSLKNPQMKSIQMILYSYFLILGKVIGNGENSQSYIQNIDFCSASNKLKVYDGPPIILEKKEKKVSSKKKKDEKKINEIKVDEIKIDENKIVVVNEEEKIIIETPQKKKGSAIKYADKKKIAIEHAKYYVLQNPDYIDFFNDHKKKDDLADSFLQGLYYLKMKNK
jgi:hypothetical protein